MMNLSIRQLRYLCEAAHVGSLQGAARALRISQSSIQAALDLAEGELGAAIFVRRPARGVSLTPAGERFIAAARQLLAAHGDFERQAGNLSVMPRELRLGCFEPFGALFMTGVLRRYIAEAGDMSVALMEGDQPQLQAWLAAGTVDAVVTYDIGTTWEAALPICRVPTHVVMHRDDPLATAPSVSLAEIGARPLVLLDLPMTASFLTAVFDLQGIRPRIAFRSRSYETVRSAVAHGLGLSILNMRPTDGFSADPPSIIRLPIRDELSPPALILADVYGERKPAFLRAFAHCLKSYFAEIGPRGFAVTLPAREEGLL